MKYFSNTKIAHTKRKVKDYFWVFLGYLWVKFNTLLLYHLHGSLKL